MEEERKEGRMRQMGDNDIKQGREEGGEERRKEGTKERQKDDGINNNK